jgi:hypothetical protein
VRAERNKKQESLKVKVLPDSYTQTTAANVLGFVHLLVKRHRWQTGGNCKKHQKSKA